MDKKLSSINASRSEESAVGTLSPTVTNGTVRTLILPKIFHLAVVCNGLDYVVFEGDNGEEVDVENNNDDDDDD